MDLFEASDVRFHPGMSDTAAALTKTMKGLFPERLDLKITEASPDEIVGTIRVENGHCTMPGVMHGGAIMAMADTLGAYGTVMNLPQGAGTTTIESKTNFFNRATTGETVTGVSTPLHKGRRTMVWRTEVRREDDKLVAVVTQTQMVLEAQLSPEQQMGALFGGDEGDNQALLAKLERSGGDLYRSWAANASSDEDRAALLEGAEREDLNAELLERLVAAKP